MENVEIITPQEAAEAAKLLRHAFAPSEGKAEYVERSEVIDDSLIADVIRGPNGELLDFLALDTRYRVEFVWQNPAQRVVCEAIRASIAAL